MPKKVERWEVELAGGGSMYFQTEQEAKDYEAKHKFDEKMKYLHEVQGNRAIGSEFVLSAAINFVWVNRKELIELLKYEGK